MNNEKIEELIQYPLFKSITGSHLYGTFTDESDLDYLGFILPPVDVLIGIYNFERKQKFFEQDGENIDLIIYSLKRFIELIIKGDPKNTEVLFNENCYFKNKKIKELINILKKDVVSNKFYKAVMGFSNSQWRKAMVTTKTYKYEPVKTRLKKLNNLVKSCNLNKDEKKQIKNILGKKIDSKIISSYDKMEERRQKEFDKYGYCLKNAMHSIRLLEEVEEFLRTGNIIFPRPNANVLLSIRKGKLLRNEVIKEYNNIREKAEGSINKSVLRDKPKTENVWKFYKKFVLNYINYNHI